jgi:rhamnulokinase
MELASKQKTLIAVDLGAQSCRVSLLRWNQGNPTIRLVHRFPNGPRETADGLRWDIGSILRGVKDGIRLCAGEAPEGIVSLAVDGWAVDYVRLKENGAPAADPYCYRDLRTERAEKEVHALLSPSQLYSLTGIQILRINTLYQLYADKLAGVGAGMPWINLPEFVSHTLGGKPVSEYTNATHTGLVTVGTHDWCAEIFRKAALDESAAPQIVASGTTIGEIQGELADLPQLRGTGIIAPACHDTASAIAAIPAEGDDWAFISSGTWSLVGTVLSAPCVSAEARELNFTNLGGVGGKICFLKNVNGMWLLQQCTEQWERNGVRWPLQDLLIACEALPAPAYVINVDEAELMMPGDMLAKINRQLGRLGQKPLATGRDAIPSVANLIFYSLAARYAEVVASIQTLTFRRLRRLVIVGGGNQNALLNRLTAERSGLQVVLGSTESATIGNFAVQLAALQGDWEPSHGVLAASVTRWAEQLMSSEMIVSAGRASR